MKFSIIWIVGCLINFRFVFLLGGYGAPIIQMKYFSLSALVSYGTVPQPIRDKITTFFNEHRADSVELQTMQHWNHQYCTAAGYWVMIIIFFFMFSCSQQVSETSINTIVLMLNTIKSSQLYVIQYFIELPGPGNTVKNSQRLKRLTSAHGQCPQIFLCSLCRFVDVLVPPNANRLRKIPLWRLLL